MSKLYEEACLTECLLRFSDVLETYRLELGEEPPSLIHLAAFTVQQIGLDHLLDVESLESPTPAVLDRPIEAKEPATCSTMDVLREDLEKAPIDAISSWIACVRHLAFSFTLTKLLLITRPDGGPMIRGLFPFAWSGDVSAGK